MDHKQKLIVLILEEHILHAVYKAVFDIFNKEFGIDLFTTHGYEDVINPYKAQLTSRLIQYIDKIYSQEEIIEMSMDANSPLYHRMVTTEYTDIAASETRVFSHNLRNKFSLQGISKKTWWHKVTSFFN